MCINLALLTSSCTTTFSFMSPLGGATQLKMLGVKIKNTQVLGDLQEKRQCHKNLSWRREESLQNLRTGSHQFGRQSWLVTDTMGQEGVVLRVPKGLTSGVTAGRVWAGAGKLQEVGHRVWESARPPS